MATSAPTRVPSARPTTAVKSRGRRPVRLARLALGGMAWAVFLFSCGVRGGWAILGGPPDRDARKRPRRACVGHRRGGARRPRRPVLGSHPLRDAEGDRSVGRRGQRRPYVVHLAAVGRRVDLTGPHRSPSVPDRPGLEEQQRLLHTRPRCRDTETEPSSSRGVRFVITGAICRPCGRMTFGSARQQSLERA